VSIEEQGEGELVSLSARKNPGKPGHSRDTENVGSGRPGTCTTEENTAENRESLFGCNSRCKDVAEIDPQLAEIVTAWEQLDESTKAKVLAIIRRH
jgi:hypothetical protein